ncbi:Chondroitin synthase [Planctomycetes bacterium Pla163]|uniref:Chondroitin synthase n=1 Tax=Rohdeia mirabilis TaxID=2528008 RepID=A0A518CY92_9BACT|nr:Chondroitin synthase [Planctomycetes bacterium Pla163]
MRNCLVLGSGRSGTSMVTGALARAGYFMGESLHAPRAANPKGFFEAPEINGLNEDLLAGLLPADTDLGEGQRWLGVPVPGARARATAEQSQRILAAASHAPFCFKDPRFSFTLPAWSEVLAGAGAESPALVCVFRHPASTATSMVTEVGSAPYLAGVHFDAARAFELWIATYRAVLEQAKSGGDWLFLHYDQVLAGDGLERLASFVGAAIDAEFPDARMRRDVPEIAVPTEALEIYRELCELARFAPAEGTSAPRTRVGVIVPVERGEEDGAAAAVANARAQRGVDVEVVVLDRSGAFVRLETLAGARVLHSISPAVGVDLRAAAAALGTSLVALERPGCPSLPARLAQAVERLTANPTAGVPDVVTCDSMLTDEHGQFVQRQSPAAMGDTPGPAWDAGLVAHSRWFEGLPSTAFHPVVLAHWRTSVHAGRAGHVLEPGYTLPSKAYASGWERARADARLVTLAAEPIANERPRLSVSICTYDRREVLVECLEAFCRQELRPGTFEIVLVDDGSSDGTDELLRGLEFPVPVTHLRRENGGLSAARNTGLEVARGEYVLFVNDDTIPRPDCVAEHLAAHRAAQLVGEDRLAVLGTFEQPESEFPTALAQALVRSNVVFDYASLDPSQRYDAWKFWTCNVSVRLDMVRAVGGFDPSFRHYGCEDTDLAVRLEKFGMQVLYHPRARAVHRHDMDFDYLVRRGRTVARAYVRLVRKHPELLERWGNESLRRDTCDEQTRARATATAVVERTCAELARIRPGHMRRLGGVHAARAEAVVEQLAELLKQASTSWWLEGNRDGMDEHGLGGFDELLADGSGPLPIATQSERRLFAWPRWNDPVSLDRLMERIEPAVAGGFASLVLRLDPVTDPMQPDAIAALEAAFARRFPADVDLDVVLDDGLHDGASLARLGRSIDAFLPLGGEPNEFTDGIAAERLVDVEAVASWRRRFEGRVPVAAPAARPLPAPRVSIVVPTRDRGAQLGQLIDRLALQDVDPLDMEVIVVDDGSRTPVPTDLAARNGHLCVRVLHTDPLGPCAARNRGVEVARGELIVFLNDDAVPAADLVSRHIAAQTESTLPRAVVGRFSLLPEHVTDSLGRYLETTTSLFAQPLMQAGVHYHGLSLCTGNVSLPRELIVRVGGFDEGFAQAGGEDSEMGLRLERETGLRVVYDPTIECGHDHALDVRSLANRKRTVGRSIHRIQMKHGDLGLAAGLPWPLAPSQWEQLAAELEAEAREIELLIEGVERTCAAERERKVPGAALEGLRPHLARIERHQLLQGLADAALPSGLALAA